jgi:hypothetical protein
VVFLERKLRTSRLVSKRRTTIPLADLTLLPGGPDDAAWAGHWFARRLDARQMHPVCQVSYHRHARVGIGLYGPLRLTFDDRIRVLACREYGFGPGPGTPALQSHTIIEMKYRLEPPAVLKQLIEEFKLVPTSVSKYRLGMEALSRSGIATGRCNANLAVALVASPDRAGALNV